MKKLLAIVAVLCLVGTPALATGWHKPKSGNTTVNNTNNLHQQYNPSLYNKNLNANVNKNNNLNLNKNSNNNLNLNANKNFNKIHNTNNINNSSKSRSKSNATSNSNSSANANNTNTVKAKGGNASATGGDASAVARGGKGGQGGSGGDASNSITFNEGDEADIPVSSAYAPALTSSDDTCMGSSSVGGQGVGFGLSLGTTWEDEDCRRRKNARFFHNTGNTGVAITLMCEDDEVYNAVMVAGTREQRAYCKVSRGEELTTEDVRVVGEHKKVVRKVSKKKTTTRYSYND